LLGLWTDVGGFWFRILLNILKQVYLISDAKLKHTEVDIRS